MNKIRTLGMVGLYLRVITWWPHITENSQHTRELCNMVFVYNLGTVNRWAMGCLLGLQEYVFKKKLDRLLRCTVIAQFIPWNTHLICYVLFCFVVVIFSVIVNWQVIDLPIFFKVASLALGQSYIKVRGLAQDCSKPIANALELLQSCTKPLL